MAHNGELLVNPELSRVIAEFIDEKRRVPILINPDNGEPVVASANLDFRTVENDMGRYMFTLNSWAADPVNNATGGEGVAWEVLLRLILSERYPYLHIIPSPAEWDFVRKSSGITTSDLIVGSGITQDGVEHFRPDLFIAATLKDRHGYITHSHIPRKIVFAAAKDLLGGDYIHDITNFGLEKDVIGYVRRLHSMHEGLFSSFFGKVIG